MSLEEQQPRRRSTESMCSTRTETSTGQEAGSAVGGAGAVNASPHQLTAVGPVALSSYAAPQSPASIRSTASVGSHGGGPAEVESYRRRCAQLEWEVEEAGKHLEEARVDAVEVKVALARERERVAQAEEQAVQSREDHAEEIELLQKQLQVREKKIARLEETLRGLRDRQTSTFDASLEADRELALSRVRSPTRVHTTLTPRSSDPSESASRAWTPRIDLLRHVGGHVAEDATPRSGVGRGVGRSEGMRLSESVESFESFERLEQRTRTQNRSCAPGASNLT